MPMSKAGYIATIKAAMLAIFAETDPNKRAEKAEEFATAISTVIDTQIQASMVVTSQGVGFAGVPVISQSTLIV